jgi:hypothetical protein
MINIGLWGAASEGVETFVRQNRDVEKKLTELGGRKVLYSHTYYTEEEFWGLYDRGWYERLREKYGATTLPTLYDKIQVDPTRSKWSKKGKSRWIGRLASTWPLPGLLGILCAIRSKDYLIHRQPCWTYWKEPARPSQEVTERK